MAEFNPQFSKLGEILIHLEKIDELQLNRALADQQKSGEKLGAALMHSGAITENDLVTVYAMQLGYQAIEEDNLFKADLDVVKLIPEDFAREHSLLALAKSNSTIQVAR